jgi:hypothetical protein
MDPELVLAEVDWRGFEDGIAETLRDAVDLYRDEHGSDPAMRVYQVSVWTDIQARTTAVSFETMPHAAQQTMEHAQWAREHGLDEMARMCERLPYNTNPADFLHSEYHLVEHPELAPLARVDYCDPEQARAAEDRVADALLRAVQRAIRDGAIAELPAEDNIWVGTSGREGNHAVVWRVPPEQGAG